MEEAKKAPIVLITFECDICKTLKSQYRWEDNEVTMVCPTCKTITPHTRVK